MKLKKSAKIKELLFLKSLSLLKSTPTKAGLMVLFDVLFLVSFYSLNKLIVYFSQYLAIPTTLASAFVFVLYSLIYYLIILLAYSFFKYLVLDSIKSLFEKTVLSFKKLSQFYLLNIVIAGIFFAVMLLFNYILAGVKVAYQPYVFILLAAPYLLFLYVIINVSHSLFYQGASIKNSIKKSFKITFTKMNVYRETILAMIFFAIVLWAVLYGSGYLLKLLVSKNYTSYLITYSYFKQITIIILDLAFYLIILINRVSFYAITKEN